MRIDFHIHSAVSRQIGFDLSFFRQTIKSAKQAGLDGLALTDHFGSKNLARIHMALDHEFDYVGPYYLADGLKLFPGLEMGVSEGCHLIAVSNRSSILLYRNRLRQYVSHPEACSTHEFLAAQQGLELLTVFAHPFRTGREIWHVDADLYPQFDALDMNGRDLHFLGPEIRRRTEEFAREYGMAVVAGSDSHHYYQLGTVHSDIESSFGSIAQLKALLHSGAYSLHVHKALSDKVVAARKAKALLKQEKLGVA